MKGSSMLGKELLFDSSEEKNSLNIKYPSISDDISSFFHDKSFNLALKLERH